MALDFGNGGCGFVEVVYGFGGLRTLKSQFDVDVQTVSRSGKHQNIGGTVAQR